MPVRDPPTPGRWAFVPTRPDNPRVLSPRPMREHGLAYLTLLIASALIHGCKDHCVVIVARVARADMRFPIGGRSSIDFVRIAAHTNDW